MGERLIDGLARVTTEGFLYRVDMRLRPWGKVGPLVSSPDGFISYLTKHALLWEKQALLKARVVAGSRAVGDDFLRRAHPLMFDGQIEIRASRCVCDEAAHRGIPPAERAHLGRCEAGRRLDP